MIEETGQLGGNGPARFGKRRHGLSEAAALPLPYASPPRYSDTERIETAARDLSLVACPAALGVLRSLANGPRFHHDLGEIDGIADVLEHLISGGLIHGALHELYALTPRGRAVWMSVRSLVQ